MKSNKTAVFSTFACLVLWWCWLLRAFCFELSRPRLPRRLKLETRRFTAARTHARTTQRHSKGWIDEMRCIFTRLIRHDR